MPSTWGNTTLKIQKVKADPPTPVINEKPILPDPAINPEQTTSLIYGGVNRSVVEIQGTCTLAEIQAFFADMSAATRRVLVIALGSSNIVNAYHLIKSLSYDVEAGGSGKVNYSMSFIRSQPNV